MVKVELSYQNIFSGGLKLSETHCRRTLLVHNVHEKVGCCNDLLTRGSAPINLKYSKYHLRAQNSCQLSRNAPKWTPCFLFSLFLAFTRYSAWRDEFILVWNSRWSLRRKKTPCAELKNYEISWDDIITNELKYFCILTMVVKKLNVQPGPVRSSIWAIQSSNQLIKF